MIYVISKSTFGSYNVRDIQCNANWDCCPYSDYALIPDSLVDGILATQGYCDITLNSSGTEVVSFTARAIPPAPKECRGVTGAATYPKAVSGEVITADDSIAAPLPSLTLYGKTTQVTTTGSNFLNIEMMTADGIEKSVDSNGYVTFTNSKTWKMYPSYDIEGFNGILHTNIEIVSISGAAGVYAANSADDYSTYVNSVGKKNIAKKVDGFFRFMVAIDPGASVTFRASVSVNADAVYEPYTGGKASPNPDYPQELVSAGNGGAINTSVGGKNIAEVANSQSVTSRYQAMVTIAPIQLLPGVSYVLSFDTENTGINCYINSNAFSYQGFKMDGTRKSFVYTYAAGKAMTVTGGTVTLVTRDSETSDVASGKISNVQVEIATVATAYEPYKPVQTLTASTPNGLQGIPVESGGNYTDEYGQQWICDEIDFARGVRVQRVTTDNIDNYAYFSFLYRNSQYTNFAYYNAPNRLEGKGLATHFAHNVGATNLTASGFYYGGGALQVCFENSVLEKYGAVSGDEASYRIAFQAWWREQATAGKTPTFMLALKTPIETPLSAEELAQYAALHTNKPNTTVMNDAGAYMDAEYYATNAAVPVEAGAANEGKFLRVVNGAAAWVTVNSAEGGSF